MSLLFETIKVEGKKFHNLAYHNNRLNSSRFDLFGAKEIISLDDVLRVPDLIDEELHKCKVNYQNKIEKVEFSRYQPKSIQTLKVVHSDNFKYSYKYTDRTEIDRLFQKRAECDDILIVQNGMVTDTSYCNIIFFDGKKWVTPNTPLLQGTKRALLLDQGEIVEAPVKLTDLSEFSHFMLINAMLDFEKERQQPIEQIVF